MDQAARVSSATATATFVFADLAGFTALTAAHGDEEATAIAQRFAGAVRALLPEHEAEEIKTIGDEVMIRVVAPVEAVRLGLRIVQELAAPGSPPVRVGMHSGPALARDGDWFGGTVNLASRIAGAARAGEVLVTDETRRSCAAHAGFEFEPRGPRYFKHLPQPVPIFRVLASGGASRPLDVDPVCRMAVDPHRAAARRRRRGFTYHFCSPDCATAFAANPRAYVATSPAARAARKGFLFNLTAFLVVGAIHVVDWAVGGGHHNGVPSFLYIGAAWATALVLHYRTVRRAL